MISKVTIQTDRESLKCNSSLTRYHVMPRLG